VSQSGAPGRDDADAELVARHLRPHALGMFTVTEEDAAAIRAAFDQEGELSAAIELRRRFPGVTDNANARQWARTIAGWKPLSAPPGRIRRNPGRPEKS
jgi:D-serine deaminase-like pyridoxal phosphate-dependent protein